MSDVKIKNVSIDETGDYHLEVSCSGSSAKCSQCANRTSHCHGHCKETVVEHLPILDRRVFIHVKWPRFVCKKCDGNPTTSFHPDWLNKTGEFTKSYEDFVLKNLINSTAKDVAEKLSVTEEIVEGIVERRISTNIEWDSIKFTRLGMDEIALRKGHDHYLTIVTDISISKNTKILGVIDGRKEEDITPFLKSIPHDLLLSLESICIDMGSSYFPTLKRLINDDEVFNRIVTIDRFHVAKLIGEKVDKERKKVMRDLKKKYENDEETLEQLKSTMWPFRHHPEDLSKEEKNRLNRLFELEPQLKECYHIREDLYRVFEMDLSKEEAKIKIDAWCLMAHSYRDKGRNPFESFIETYYRYEENILNYFTHRHTSGPVEGLNNKIKVIKRRGFGFRNVKNFARRLFLDINYKSFFIPNPIRI